MSSTTDTDLFSGTGGPFAYDPFFGGFAGIVSSQGIFGEPFHDQLKGVNASDQVLFVIAIQNFANVSAYDIKLRDFMPLASSSRRTGPTSWSPTAPATCCPGPETCSTPPAA